ncbi:MAG TPA: NUDIX domain-containing protein [Anaerolineales bacterium]|nr:NUDIX domain-containing protein [Anaerolineales bacterium]
MQILTEIHRAEGINTHGKTVHRTAVRAVILRGPELLMVYSSNVGDYKFPGGGVDIGETHQQALARELLEECGASLLSVDGELGAIIEYNFADEKLYDVFKMTSSYYFCQIREEFVSQKLDGYEKELGFQPLWINIDKAILLNRSLLATDEIPQWLRREIFILEYLKHSM